MKKKVIIYYSICFLPDGNAMCRRAKSMSNYIIHENRIPVIIGVNKTESLEKFFINDVLCYTLPYPKTFGSWIKFIISIKPIIKIVKEIGEENIESIIASDLKSIQLIKMKKFCRRNNFKIILDILDWYGKSSERFPKNILKNLDTYLTMNFLYYTINRCITVSSNLYGKFNKNNINCIRIPMVYDNCIYNDKLKKMDKKLRFIFAGKPGRYCEKEKLDWIIEIFSGLKFDFELIIIGIEEKEFFLYNQSLKKLVDDRITFYGDISYELCTREIQNSDFYLLIREKTRLSDFGFSTKLMESFKFKVPLIATDTGDVNLYVKDGYNGFICKADKKSLNDKIVQLFTRDYTELRNLKENIDVSKLLESNFYDEFRKVIT